MSSGPETRYTNRIRKRLMQLAPGIYHMKLQAGFVAGIPDMWFSGSKSDLWVEMKWDERTVRTRTPFMPALSALQQQWLDDRLEQGRNVAVITGHPLGGIIQVNGAWNGALSNEEFFGSLQPLDEVTKWIINQIN